MNRKDFLRSCLSWLAALPVFNLPQTAWAAQRVPKPKGDWDIQEFSFEANGKAYPGIAVKLPASVGVQDNLIVACKICPHQGCEFGFEKNYRAVGNIVGKELNNPIFFCRCHMSVFDPTANGKVLNGPAPNPPWLFTFKAGDTEIEIQSIPEGAGIVETTNN
jgi:Rieske Fe-S protein